MRPREIIDYWLAPVGPAGWYAGGATLDGAIRDRFAGLWEEARARRLASWCRDAPGALAFILLTDQFPRNMFRDRPEAFATDALALAAAREAVRHRWDMAFAEPGRQFFYLPFMHAETRHDQDRCVRLILTRMPETGAGNLLHARAHRAVIRRFGRFPTRNAALGRASDAAETAWLAAGGYGAEVRALPAAAG
ncbi:MAG: DUF924 domain-containing protein [Rhodobacteraceae bacterium]|nr:DUF924 domain-containing protein [Paracoccaceae bacterium]